MQAYASLQLRQNPVLGSEVSLAQPVAELVIVLALVAAIHNEALVEGLGHLLKVC